MQANSRIPASAQTGIHEHLDLLLERHCRSPFLKPYSDYTVSYTHLDVYKRQAQKKRIDSKIRRGLVKVLRGRVDAQ